MSNLDPRGLEAAARAVRFLGGGGQMSWRDLSTSPLRYAKCHSDAAIVVRAYLDAVQPVITTVEELEGLEVGTAIQTVDESVTEVWTTDGAGGNEWSLAGSCQRFSAALIPLPARVIWMPHESA